MNSQYKNIVWDWNGTIVDDAWVFVDIMNSVLVQQGLPLTTLKHYRKNFCFPIQEYWKGLGFQFTSKTFNQLNALFIKEYQKKMLLPTVHGGLSRLLQDLNKKRVRQFVLSASENKLLKKAVVYYRLFSFFQGIYGVDNLNAVGKESLGRLLCTKHRLLPHETLFIGDTEYDYRVAKSLGCAVVLVSYGHINHRRLLKVGVPVVSSVGNLKKFLQTKQ